jgi:TolB-like protein/Tfp pilus assembly protein PilF
MKHKVEIPIEPKALNTQVPEDVSRLILKCMEKDKEKRYQNAEELQEELEKIEEGIPFPERRPKKKTTTSKEITVTFSPKKLVIPAAAVIAVVIAAFFIWQNLSRKELISPPSLKPSVAVLPFEDLSSKKDQGYLCDGLAESLINALTHIQDLRIPARTSSFSFKDKEKDISEIGQKLDVKAIFEGSVQKSGNRIRITAQLINAEDESLIWSEQYNRELDDVFAIQDDITLAIVDKLRINLLGGERTKLLKRYTENAEAYELYLKGRYFWDWRTYEAMKRSIEFFESAIEMDPDFALPYTGISDCYASIGWYSMIPKETAYERAKETAEKALEVDDTLSEAHVSLANVKTLYYWDWEGAEQSYVRALELNPSNAEAHHQYAHFLTMKGQTEEGVAEMKRALKLEPLSAVINSCLGQNLYFDRKYDAAIVQLLKAIEMDPNLGDPFGWLGKAYLQKGMLEQAKEMFQKGTIAQRLKAQMLGALGYAYAVEGKEEEAQKMLQQLRKLSEEQYVDPYYSAWINTGLGEKEIALDWLNRAYEEKSNWMITLKPDPFFESLHSDPRFKELLKKIGLD